MVERATTTAATAVSREGVILIGKSPLFQEGSRRARKFNLGPKAPVCDVVMKGGVTSGVVYPYAVLRLAQKFRLAGIGGTSAGAIAAALTAAAEYARQAKVRGSSFSRFEERCMNLPKILPTLFQPLAKHRSVFALAMATLKATDNGLPRKDRLQGLRDLFFSAAGLQTWSVIGASVVCGMLAAARYSRYYGWHQSLWAAGFGLGSGLLLLLLFLIAVRWTSQLPIFGYVALVAVAAAASIAAPIRHPAAVFLPAVIGGGFGMVAAITFLGNRLIGRLRDTDFGLCSGLKAQETDPDAVTDWLHNSIQYVAGRGIAGDPLTFGDVQNVLSSKKDPNVALRMITTNITLRRPYALPDLGGEGETVGWIPDEWKPLFPKTVIDFMMKDDPSYLTDDKPRRLPDGDDLPVVVGARMSLSFPLLFSAVPVHQLTPGGWASAGRMLLVDGGLSSNMPLHFFDSLGPPAYPTFAFNLDDDARLGPPPKPAWPQRVKAAWAALTGRSTAHRLRETLRLAAGRPVKPFKEPPEASRISLHMPGDPSPSLTHMPTSMLGQYLGGLLGAAKDWQDNLLSIMPGQSDRIVRIGLAPGEGGLNLTMPASRSRKLMRLGYRAGAELAIGFDLDAHRVRRALAAYQEIERVAEVFERTWTNGRLQTKLKSARAPVDSPAWQDTTARQLIIDRFGELATWALTLHPPVRNHLFPRPRGALRLTPNLSGDQ